MIIDKLLGRGSRDHHYLATVATFHSGLVVGIGVGAFLARVGILLLLVRSLAGLGAEDYVKALHVIGAASCFSLHLGPIEEEYLPSFLQQAHSLTTLRHQLAVKEDKASMEPEFRLGDHFWS